MNYREKLVVKPERRVRLEDLDPGYHGKHESEGDAKRETEETLLELTKLQRLLYGEHKHALLIVLQGLDAAGKDGVCWHIMKAMNPQGTTVVGFKQPTPEDLAHDFLWRVHPHVPARGRVAVLGRSPRRTHLYSPEGTHSAITKSRSARRASPRTAGWLVQPRIGREGVRPTVAGRLVVDQGRVAAGSGHAQATPDPVEPAIAGECLKDRRTVLVTAHPDGPTIVGAVQVAASTRPETLRLEARDIELCAAKSIVLRVGKSLVILDEQGAMQMFGEKMTLRMAKTIRALKSLSAILEQRHATSLSMKSPRDRASASCPGASPPTGVRCTLTRCSTSSSARTPRKSSLAPGPRSPRGRTRCRPRPS